MNSALKQAVQQIAAATNRRNAVTLKRASATQEKTK